VGFADSTEQKEQNGQQNGLKTDKKTKKRPNEIVCAF